MTRQIVSLDTARPRVLPVGVGAVGFTGRLPTILTPRTMTPGAGLVAVTGRVPTVAGGGGNGGSGEPGDIYSNNFETPHGPFNDRWGRLNWGGAGGPRPININLVQNASLAADGEWFTQSLDLGLVGSNVPGWTYQHTDYEGSHADHLYVRQRIFFTAFGGTESPKTIRFFTPSNDNLGYVLIRGSGQVGPGSVEWHFSDPLPIASGGTFRLNTWHWIEVGLTDISGAAPRVRVWLDGALIIDTTGPGASKGAISQTRFLWAGGGPSEDQPLGYPWFIRFDQIDFATSHMGVPRITGVTFDSGSVVVTAVGSDNWPLCWADDDHQYTSFGDGDGFQVTPPDDERHGFARIDGASHNSFIGTDLAEYDRHTDPLGGKVESMICLNNIIYALRSPGSDTGGWDYKEMWKSTDHCVTFTQPFPRILENAVQGDATNPVMIVYGKNQLPHDGYVYFLCNRLNDPTLWEVQAPGEMYLARGLIAGEAFCTQADWDWCTAISGGGAPTWQSQASGGYANRVSVLDDARGFMRSSCIYLKEHGRFVLVTNHTARNAGNLSMWEAPTPWGPWTQFYNRNAGDPFDTPLEFFAFASISPKWRDELGNFTMTFFRPDRWNSVEGTLTLQYS